MFICNFKINSSKIKRIVFISFILLVIIILLFVVYKVYDNKFSRFKVDDDIPQNDINDITTANYTNVLKCVHEDIELYVGQKIRFTGFVYRAYDFNDNQFVLGREMLINSNFQAVIVGFLCEYSSASSFVNDTWVEIEGEICKGTYHSEVPIIKITSMKKVSCPQNEYVYPPDDTYIPTSTIL